MAIACLRLFTFLPDRPLLSVPRFRSRMARSTFLPAFLPYFLAIGRSSSDVRWPGPRPGEARTMQNYSTARIGSDVLAAVDLEIWIRWIRRALFPSHPALADGQASLSQREVCAIHGFTYHRTSTP